MGGVVNGEVGGAVGAVELEWEDFLSLAEARLEIKNGAPRDAKERRAPVATAVSTAVSTPEHARAPLIDVSLNGNLPVKKLTPRAAKRALFDVSLEGNLPAETLTPRAARRAARKARLANEIAAARAAAVRRDQRDSNPSLPSWDPSHVRRPPLRPI